MITFLTDISLQYKEYALALHLFAMVIGLGGATYTDILLAKFLKDLQICEKEVEVIHTMSNIILVGIVLAFISGSMLFLPEADRLLYTPKFLVKVIAFLVLTINGFFLHKIVLPQLIDFSFHKDVCIGTSPITLRHLGFVMGPISFVSWYTAFIIGAFREIPGTFNQLLGIYIALLIGGIIVSLGIEKSISKKLQYDKKNCR